MRLSMQFDSLFGRFISSRWSFPALFVIVLIIAAYLRLGLLHYYGFFEPDGFFYYAVVRQTVQNGFALSKTLNISGIGGVRNPIGEAPGLIYMTVIPYFFLRFVGINYYDIMRLVPVFAGVFEIAGAYLLAKYLSKSRWFGLIAMLFVAVSNGNESRTGATIYRGDTFISLFIIASLLLLLISLNEENRRKQAAYAAGSGIALSLGFVVWNGAPFTTAVYMAAIAFIAAYAFVVDNERLLYGAVVAAVAGLLLSYLLVNVFVYVGLARHGIQLTGLNFLILYVPLLAGAAAALLMLRNRSMLQFIEPRANRAVIAASVMVVLLLLVYLFFGSFVNAVLSAVIGTGGIGTTTQELQRPDFNFIYYSFGLQSFLALAGVLLFLFFSHHFDGPSESDGAQMPIAKVNISNGFLVLLAYLAVTSYLQYFAIRYNAILSIPLAVFAAYPVYVLGRVSRGRNTSSMLNLLMISIVIAIAYAYMVYSQVLGWIAGPQPLDFLTLVSVSTLLIIVISFFYLAYALVKRNLALMPVFISLALVLMLFSFRLAYVNDITSAQADGINSEFINAMNWLHNNTAHNATTLAVWTDGSVIEGWANRSSYVDSVGGENSSRIVPESLFLFNTSNDTQFLYRIGKPQYIVSRYFWYYELSGLLQEGGIENRSKYNYALLGSVNITNNNTGVYYYFRSQEGPLVALFEVMPYSNSSQRFAAYAGNSGSSLYEIRNVVLYDEQNYNYTLLRSGITNALNDTLVVSYYLNRTTKKSVITSSSILAPDLLESNFYKFTYLCNYNYCPFGDGNVTARAVFINNDTRIIKLTYR